MPIELHMPGESEALEKGSLARWLKSEGDAIQAGDVIAEIETDKATMEFEAPASGVLQRILVPSGTEDVAAGTLIGLMSAADERESPTVPNQRADSAPPSPPAEPAGPVAARPSERPAGRIIASPVARRAAQQQAVDLSAVSGSGPGGRIVLRDVAAASSAASTITTPAATPFATAATAATAATTGEFAGTIQFDDVKLSSMRQVIAKRLTESKQNIPHFYLSADIELDELLRVRASVNAISDKKVSINDFLIKALATALIRNPDANVQFMGDTLRRFKRADISVAVAIPGGLVTPVIRSADRKTLLGISSDMNELLQKARAGKLSPAEYQGGTFSLSNLGMFGVKEFTAIINPPQAGILAAGAGQLRAVVKNGQLSTATVMTAVIAFDHRAIDGAVGAGLLATLKQLLENPLATLISESFL